MSRTTVRSWQQRCNAYCTTLLSLCPANYSKHILVLRRQMALIDTNSLHKEIHSISKCIDRSRVITIPNTTLFIPQWIIAYSKKYWVHPLNLLLLVSDFFLCLLHLNFPNVPSELRAVGFSVVLFLHTHVFRKSQWGTSPWTRHRPQSLVFSILISSFLYLGDQWLP